MKVAAGASGAGQPESRWGESIMTRVLALGCLPLPAITAGGLMVRSGEGLPMEIRVGGNYGVWAPGQRKSRLKRERWRKTGSRQTVSENSLPGQWFVPLFKAARFFLPTHRLRAGLLWLKQMKGAGP